MLAVLAALTLAAPAAADFDPRFTVVDETTVVRHTATGFRFAGELTDPREGGKAGYERVHCFLSGPNQAQCLGLVHLNGRVGGAGKLRFAGDVDGDERRMRITGGKGDFEALKGNVRLRGLGSERTRFRFELRL